MKLSNLFITVFFTGLVLTFGCSTQQSNSNNETESSEVPEIDMAEVQENIDKGRFGDSTMFPYVYSGEGYSNLFEAYTMKFKLGYEPPLIPMTNINIPWVDPEAYSEQNGLFITYVENGRELSLYNPYIQAQYISKKLPYCSTIDSVYYWLDSNFLDGRGGKVTKEKVSENTASGLTAISKEYSLPTQGEGEMRKDAKFMAYAYIEYDENYLIGFALTTTNQPDYENNLPRFYNIVRSFDYP